MQTVTMERRFIGRNLRCGLRWPCPSLVGFVVYDMVQAASLKEHPPGVGRATIRCQREACPHRAGYDPGGAGARRRA